MPIHAEEAQINDLLVAFKDAILKTGEDLNMLNVKFDSDMKQNCKSNLEAMMRGMINLENQLTRSNEVATIANRDIGNACKSYYNSITNEHAEFDDGTFWDEEDNPTFERPNSARADTAIQAYHKKILDDDSFDVLKAIKVPKRKAKYKNDPRMKNLKAILAQKDADPDADADAEAEEEIVASAVETIPIDPYTKKKIRNPVKNAKCGHLYDKDGIETYMKSTNKPRCPYIGCSNRDAIRPVDLVVDNEAKLRIEALMEMEDSDETDSSGE